MALFENVPYVNFHEMNLDWILKFIQETRDKLDQIEAAVIAAQAAQAGAETARAGAEEAAGSSADSAADAENYAAQAAGSATQAAASATQAAQSATNAAASATQAQQSASAAGNSATQAAQSNAASAQNANAAAQSASSAAQSAGTATTAAGTATQQATAAAASAAEAAESAGSIDLAEVYKTEAARIWRARTKKLTVINSYTTDDSVTISHAGLVVVRAPHSAWTPADTGASGRISDYRYMEGVASVTSASTFQRNGAPDDGAGTLDNNADYIAIPYRSGDVVTISGVEYVAVSFLIYNARTGQFAANGETVHVDFTMCRYTGNTQPGALYDSPFEDLNA